jgi:hypothetical protein
MLLSRFWYVLLGLVVGALVFVLFLAQSLYNRQGQFSMAEGLSSDSQVVSWYLKNDARERSAHLIKFAVDGNIGKGLSEASGNDSKVTDAARTKVLNGLTKVAATIPKDQAFDAVFVVDQHGRVVAHLGYEQASGMTDFELGGYPVVADALHGFIRDDTLVLDRVYRVVARPVEYDLGQQPSGAIVGARIIDDRFARELSQRTGAAVAFHARGQRVASGAPEGFDRSKLDMIVNDLKEVEAEEAYKTKGRSAVRTINKSLGVVYGRLPGEAWDLGAGFVVGRDVGALDSPLSFFTAADDKDKSLGAKLGIVIGAALLAMAVGIGLTLVEHSKPLALFKLEAHRLAKGQSDALVPSRFRGVYRTIASDLNDGIDVAAGKQGGTRRAADLQQVLGDIPAEPQMSAFSFPQAEASSPAAVPSPVSSPKAKPLPKAPSSPISSKQTPPQPSREEDVVSSIGYGAAVAEAPDRRLPGLPPRPGATPLQTAAVGGGDAQNAEWQRIFDQFAATKQECGESLDGFTFEKFQNTLRKHRDAIIERHGVKRVKFSVYVKDGKAALKASPIKE